MPHQLPNKSGRIIPAIAICFLICGICVFPQYRAAAQNTVPDTAAAADNQAEDDDEKAFEQGSMEDKPVAVLQSLDKVTARTHKFEVSVGETVKFGSIYITAKTCKKAPPFEKPEAAAFLQIWQKNLSDENDTAAPKSEWIFSGWMFASSPALSAMDHPIYDVWVLDCIDKPGAAEIKSQEADATDKSTAAETDKKNKAPEPVKKQNKAVKKAP